MKLNGVRECPQHLAAAVCLLRDHLHSMWRLLLELRPAGREHIAQNAATAPKIPATSRCAQDKALAVPLGLDLLIANSPGFFAKKNLFAPKLYSKMQTSGSGPLPLGEKEAELRRRNEDVDRRRTEALRLACDVVRHQEVLCCTLAA